MKSGTNYLAPSDVQTVKMRASIKVVIATFAMLPAVALGQSASKAEPSRTAVPRFEDFRVPTPLQGRKGSAVISNGGPGQPPGKEETSARFSGRIRNEARKGPNFAGHFALVRWSCGSDCWNMVVADVESGKIYETPFVGVSACVYHLGEELSFQLNSSLLIVTGSLEIGDPKTHSFEDGPCGRFYYQWDGTRLNLIRSVVPLDAIARP